MVSCIQWSLFCIESSQDFCHLLRMNLLMIGFRSVYRIFILDISAKSGFCSSFVCPFISMYTNVTWYPGENDAIIFSKNVHFVLESCNEGSCSNHRSIFSHEPMPPPSDSATHWPISRQSALVPSSSKELFFLPLFGSLPQTESTRPA